ncbi:MAG TPA: hypothetical protein VIM58_02845, partial [Candidatus Methylacidiphilales bacterium]
MIWKEIRQNLVWSVLLLLGLGIAMAWAVGSADRNNVSRDFEHAVCGDPFLLVTTFGCPAVAFALALLQVLPETSADRWALLIHRPLPRETIFWGKIVGGLVLYLAVTLIPLVLAAWWTAVPGHLAAPFVPGMLLPGLQDVASGIPWHFAGIVFALREARWIGTKALPFFSAASVSLFTRTTYTSFPVILLLVALASVALLLFCARASFIGFRLERPVAPGTRLALAVLFAPACAALLAFAFGLAYPVFGHGPDSVNDGLEITPQGEIFRETAHYRNGMTLDVT